MGTTALFELTTESSAESDTVFSTKPTQSVDYVCKAGRKLTLKRVFLNEKKEKGK